MYQVRRLGVLSLAKIAAAVYGALGLIFVPIFLIGGLAGMASGEGEAAAGGVLFILFGLMMPLFYAGIGFIFGAFTAWIYNLLAGRIGGLEIELAAMAPPPPVA